MFSFDRNVHLTGRPAGCMLVFVYFAVVLCLVDVSCKISISWFPYLLSHSSASSLPMSPPGQCPLADDRKILQEAVTLSHQSRLPMRLSGFRVMRTRWQPNLVLSAVPD